MSFARLIIKPSYIHIIITKLPVHKNLLTFGVDTVVALRPVTSPGRGVGLDTEVLLHVTVPSRTLQVPRPFAQLLIV